MHQFPTLELFLNSEFPIQNQFPENFRGEKSLFKSRNLQSVGNILMQSLLEKDKYSEGIGTWNYPYGETDVQVIF